MDFKDITGHDKIIKHLQGAISMDKTSHAYILNGEDGSGKNLTAHIFAAALQCEEEGINPCGKCKSCVQAASYNHPDIIRVVHEKSVISVDDIRTQLNHDIQIKPYSGRYKIYIIDEAEKMNEQAQNALLKTIEEPPSYAKILLLTNNSSLFLPTILSRCVALDFKPLPKELIQVHIMKNYEVPDYLADISAAFSGGIVGKAVKYACSEEFITLKDEVTCFLKHIIDMKHQDVMDSIKFFSSNKQNIYECIDLMMLWFRDLMVYKSLGRPEYVLYKREIESIRKQAAMISFEGLNCVMGEFECLKKRLRANVNFELSLELLFFVIKNRFINTPYSMQK